MRYHTTLIALLTTLLLFFAFSEQKTYAIESDVPTGSTFFRAWPGRPNGNGDGSEEWLVGNYGETNGPYQFIGSTSGNVSDLNRQRKAFVSIVWSILTNRLPALPNFISKAIGLANLFTSDDFAGTVYTADVYVSGRSMKTVITTYYLPNYTHHCETYVIYNAW